MSRPAESPAPAVLHGVRLDDCAPQPWRNGGGFTQELLTWPACQAEWALRVSVAEIHQDGPFSPFAGVERVFAVLRGAGVQLSRAGAARRLTPDSAPWHFDGGEPPMCTRLAGASQDLNLMVRRGAGRAGMRRVADGEAPWPAGPRWRAVYLAEGSARLQRGDAPAELLPAGTLAWSEACPQAWHLQPLHPATQALWLWLDGDPR